MKNSSEYQDKINQLQIELEANQQRVRILQERYKASQTLYDDVTQKLEDLRSSGFEKGPYKFDGLTLIIAYYNIPKHIERTLMSCAPAYQKASENQIEVIIADNGSFTRTLPIRL